MKFTGQIRIPDLDHPGVPATFLIEGTQAEVILEGEESLGRWSLFDVQARRLISAAFQVEFDGEEVTFLADEPIDFAYRGLEEMAAVWARFKAMNIVRRKVAVSRSRNGTQPSRISELRAAMEENLGIRAKNVSLAGTSRSTPAVPEAGEGHVWDKPAQAIAEPEPATPPVADVEPEPETEPTIPVVSAPPSEGQPAAELETEDASEEAATVAAEIKSIEEERARLDEQLRVADPANDEVAAALAAERKAIEEERARLAEERERLEELHREAEMREQDRVEAFRLEMQRLERERQEFERLEEERKQSHLEAMERLEAEREEIEKKTAQMSQRELDDAERAAELQTKLADLEQERIRIEQAESERVEAARREMEALEERQRHIESLEELQEEPADPGKMIEQSSEEPEKLPVEPPAAEEAVEPPAVEEEPVEEEPVEEEPVEEEPVEEEPVEEELAAAEAEVVDLAELEDVLIGDQEGLAEEDEKGGPKHLREPSRRRRSTAKEEPEPQPDEVLEPETQLEPSPEPEAANVPEAEPQPEQIPEPEPAMAGAAKQSGIMGAVRAAFGRGGREHVHDFVEAPGGLGIARSICRECGYVSISTED